MSESLVRPLVTFALFAYNQEKYIREAVEGALAQDYEPMQIILSDDCSLDGTFAVMEEMAAAYSGPHRILLNRNERNLGLGDHVNRIVELAEGDLIVGAAGDDISLPQRTTALVDAWIRSNRKATSIYSGVVTIDEVGMILGSLSRYQPNVNNLAHISRGICVPHGASHAFSRQMMMNFERLERHIVNEDQVIGYRSALVGAFEYVDRPLVNYRVHEASACSGLLTARSFHADEIRTQMYRDAERACFYRRQNMSDALAVLGEKHHVIDILREQLTLNKAIKDMLSENIGLFRASGILLKSLWHGAPPLELAKIYIKRIFWPIYARYYDHRRRKVVSRGRKLNNSHG